MSASHLVAVPPLALVSRPEALSSHLIRSDLVPILGGYLILMIILAVGLWTLGRRLAAGKPISRLTGRRDRGWLALGSHVLADALGGYLLLMAIVVLYYYGVARVGSNFLLSAVTGCLLLLGIALPLFFLASWLTQRRHRPEQEQRDPAERQRR
jgi:4-amino-4-deoxy-L-arabinose transferase-like glycosyltransferase